MTGTQAVIIVLIVLRFSYSDRPVDNVRGFTREVLIGISANIETRLWRHSFNIQHNIPIEHPRASTTDDVECFSVS